MSTPNIPASPSSRVYLAVSGEYEDTATLAVFESSADAQGYVRRFNNTFPWSHEDAKARVEPVPFYVTGTAPQVQPAKDVDDVETPSAISYTADVVLFGRSGEGPGVPHVLVIRREWDPFAGKWALPGGYVEAGETAAQAAARELREETGLSGVELAPLGVYDDPNRDPRGRVVSVAHVGHLPELAVPTAGDDAAEAKWVPLFHLLLFPGALAFDHHRILRDAAPGVFGPYTDRVTGEEC
ncbi:NUDIX domain-containing protein [Amycolatopsis sp. NPDC059027]|uniref:NUDIX domain-containing protein n=1 Tax=Amycolatopsis sp. NPDC059027 TaxID=3346709 RepID=UPI0036705C12